MDNVTAAGNKELLLNAPEAIQLILLLPALSSAAALMAIAQEEVVPTARLYCLNRLANPVAGSLLVQAQLR
jgi:hypothetical protein